MTDDQNVSIEDITPEMAHEYLGFNTHNRNLRPRVVQAYAADMATGDWQWNGEAIKFAADGTLLDGQHRLAAIVESGKSIRMLVIRGLPAQTQETIDGGAKRSFGDVLKLRGESNYVSLASTIRAIATYERGSSGIGDTGVKATNAQLLRVLEKYPWLRDGQPLINNVQGKTSMPSSVAGLAWFLFVQLDADDAQHFFERLASGEGHRNGDPIYTLRKLLLTSSEGVRGARNMRFLTAVTIKAWNKFRAGERADLLKFSVGGAKPEKFPEPK